MGVVELRELRAELRASGVFEHCELRSWLKLAGLLSGIAACLFAMATFGAWSALLAIPVAAVLSTSTAMLGHEGSHRSFSASPVRNLILVYVAFPLFGGLGTLYWRNKHDRLHHAHPNVEGVDPDIKPFPFVSSRGDHERCGRGERWFQRNFQRWAFWPMSLLMALGMRRASILYLVRYPRQHGFTWAWLAEVLCMTAHYTGWLLIPSLIWGPLVAFGVYSGIWALVGVMLALVFAPAHIGLPIVVEPHHDWQHQLETTRNLELPRVISFFFIGLDYQIEHHLFPKIPHQRLGKAAAITARWCKRTGMPYQSVPYLHALSSSASFIANAWSRDAEDASAVRIRMLDVVG
ncbi:MAG TPA: fatty acid desaturase [Kofleriaceae bacterium]|jgi:fatty acid desaturase|nr:fatty acid desaturase [Kofleriaceae bacterium]